jgi:hypothetical protein
LPLCWILFAFDEIESGAELLVLRLFKAA